MATKRCVKCDEKIQWAASVCRYCSSEQPAERGPKPIGCLPVLGMAFLFIIVIFSLISMSSGPQLPPPAATSASQENDITGCVARGVAYYKDIGSYPTLYSEPNAGRSAEEVARERCRRSPTAF